MENQTNMAANNCGKTNKYKESKQYYYEKACWWGGGGHIQLKYKLPSSLSLS